MLATDTHTNVGNVHNIVRTTPASIWADDHLESRREYRFSSGPALST